MGMFWIATAILVLLIVLGMPIAFAIGIASIAFVLMASPPDLIMAPLRMYAGVNSFTLLALPFFILAAEIMIRAGVSTRLFAWVNMLVGRVRGGLAYVNIVESTIFGSISGAALSDIAALGKIEITSMVENGYEKDFSCALTAASSLQSPLIPPSSIAILYSGVMSLSVGSVLLGGAVPGVLMGLAQAVYVFANGRRLKLPKVTRAYSTREVYVIWRDGLVALLMPLIILVGIVGGVFTPTEAAAVAVLYSLVAAVFIYRNVTMRDLYDALTETVKTTADSVLDRGLCGDLFVGAELRADSGADRQISPQPVVEQKRAALLRQRPLDHRRHVDGIGRGDYPVRPHPRADHGEGGYPPHPFRGHDDPEPRDRAGDAARRRRALRHVQGR